MKGLNPVQFIKGLKNILSAETYFPDHLKNNPVLQVLMRRRSIRKFTDKDIPEEEFNTILEAGRLAPSGVNLQTWAFGIYTAETWKKVFSRPIPFSANKAVMIFGDCNRSTKVLKEFPFKPLVYYTMGVMNASIAAYAMNIAAEAMGIGSVMLSDTGKSGFYDAQYIKETLDLPDGVIPIMTIVFGYPKSFPKAMPPKIPLSELTFTEKYHEADKDEMESWLQQMIAGFRADRIVYSFNGQIKHYLSKVEQAERGLEDLIYFKEEEVVTKDKT